MSFMEENYLKDIFNIQNKLHLLMLQQNTLLEVLITIQAEQKDQLVLISKQMDAIIALKEEAGSDLH